MPESNTQINNPRDQRLIEINNVEDFPVESQTIHGVITAILSDSGFESWTVSVAIVNDAMIHRLNREYLRHDYPTDVLSFVLDQSSGLTNWIEGEVIVSGQTARRVAEEYGWPPLNELMLYVIHGSLHLAGYRDGTTGERAEMQERESHYLDLIGVRRGASVDQPAVQRDSS